MRNAFLFCALAQAACGNAHRERADAGAGGAVGVRPRACALDVLYRGEVSPAALCGGGLLAGSRGQGGWERVIAEIEAQAETLEERADEVRAAIYPETGVGLQLRQAEGVFTVGELEPAGCASLSGCVQTGDELVAIDRTPVRGLSLFEATALLRGAPGSDVVLTVARGGCTSAVSLQRTEPSDGTPRIRLSSEDRLRLAAGGGSMGSAGTWSAGIVLGDALEVESVLPGSSAAAAGVRRGDTLLSVDGMRVTGGSPSKVAALLTSRRCGVVLHLLLTRRGPSAAADGEGSLAVKKDTAETLVSVRVCCSEAYKGQGGEDAGGGDKPSLKFTSTQQTIKAVTGLLKGLFK